ncbi:beta/gamma crystallin-related protein [Duganella sp. P38]|uniref:beta/gamma crystallin-related protein n=1 Tax=Duganella sp. P38 TaxID=3423949 RepID=UPI003D7AE6C1
MRSILAAVLCTACAAAQAGDITLYSHARLGGPAITLHEATPDLDPLGFNDKTSSVVVHKGRWQVCAEKHYRGKCMILDVGEYAELPGFDNMVSSAREVDAPARK